MHRVSRDQVNQLPDKSIELSRTKLVFLIIGCSVFAFAGLWMLQLDEASIRELWRLGNPTVFRSIGGITLLFAVLILVFGLRKLFDKRPGLVLSAEGINDNSSGVAAGLNPIQRALHRANTKMVGSPISISSNTLKVGFDELCALVESYRARYSPPG